MSQKLAQYIRSVLFERGVRICSLVVMLSLLSVAPPVSAAAIIVDADCSLGDALFSAQNDLAFRGCEAGSADGTDTITITVDVELAASLSSITTDMIIEGDTASGTLKSIDAKDAHRIFIGGVAGVSVTVRNLKLANGTSTHGGGAIQMLGGELTVDNVEFEGNYGRLNGGALATSDTDVTINNSRFTSNKAGANGGAMAFASAADGSNTLTITGSTFSGNETFEGGGGALYARFGDITIKQSVFTDNHAKSNTTSLFSGGAMEIRDASTALIENTTITGNSATLQGGGIYAVDSDLRLLHNTIALNEIPTSAIHRGSLRNQALGSGLYVRELQPGENGLDDNGDKLRQIEVLNSLIAQNTGTCQCYFVGSIDDSESAFVSDGTCEADLSEAETSPLYLQLTPETNGYHNVAVGSAVLNAADGDTCGTLSEAKDQIDTTRPVGTQCDIGAIEYPASGLPTAPTAYARPANAGSTTDLNCHRPLPTATPAPSPTATETPTATATETPTDTPSPTATETPTDTPSPTATETLTDTPSPTATETPTDTPSPTATETPTVTPSPTATETREDPPQINAPRDERPAATRQPATPSPPPPTPDPDTMCRHTVEKGDTLFQIAQRHNTTVGKFRYLNMLKSDTLTVGKALIVPDCYAPSPDGPLGYICQSLYESTVIRSPSAVVSCSPVDIALIDKHPALATGMIAAVDVMGYVEAGVEVCFRTTGSLVFLDVMTDPPTPRSIESSGSDMGMTCGEVDRVGTVVLVATATEEDSYLELTSCQVTTTQTLRLRDSVGSTRVLSFVPYGATLFADARTENWFYVTFLGTKGWISAKYVETYGICS